MKNLIVSISLYAFTLSICNIAFGQEPTGDGTGGTVEDRDKAEMNTAPFDPADLYIEGAKHVIVYFDIKEGNMVLSSRPAKVVPGNMPYQSSSGGEVVVVALDKAGEKLASYYMSDIRRVRVFEGKDREASFIKEAKDLMIRLPYDPRISKLTLASTTDDKDESTYDISRSIGRIFDLKE